MDWPASSAVHGNSPGKKNGVGFHFLLQKVLNTCTLFFFLRFIDLFLVALGLCCCMWAFSSYSEQGLLLIAVPGLHTMVIFYVAELRL